MPLRHRLRRNLVPPHGLPRRLATLSLVFGLGQGVFLTGSAVFLTKVVGLRAHEIGIGLSVAAAISVAAAVPLGRLTDRLGAQRMWWTATAARGLLFGAYPWVHGFGTFLAVLITLELLGAVANAGRNVYLIDSLEPETRVVTQAFSRSWLNVGWGTGAALAGLALAVDTAPADRKGEYLSAFRMGGSVVNMIGPAALISLAVTTGGWGWFVIAAIFAAAAVTATPVIEWASARMTTDRPAADDAAVTAAA